MEKEYRTLKGMQDTLARHHFVRNQATAIQDSIETLEGYVKCTIKPGLANAANQTKDSKKDQDLGLMGLNMFVDGYDAPIPSTDEISEFDGLTSISEAENVLKDLEFFLQKELLGGQWPARPLRSDAPKPQVGGQSTSFASSPPYDSPYSTTQVGGQSMSSTGSRQVLSVAGQGGSQPAPSKPAVAMSPISSKDIAASALDAIKAAASSTTPSDGPAATPGSAEPKDEAVLM